MCSIIYGIVKTCLLLLLLDNSHDAHQDSTYSPSHILTDCIHGNAAGHGFWSIIATRFCPLSLRLLSLIISHLSNCNSAPCLRGTTALSTCYCPKIPGKSYYCLVSHNFLLLHLSNTTNPIDTEMCSLVNSPGSTAGTTSAYRTRPVGYCTASARYTV